MLHTLQMATANLSSVSGLPSNVSDTSYMLTVTSGENPGDLSVLYNLTHSDLEEIFDGTNLSDIEVYEMTPYDVSGWLFALNIISGVGVLTNSLLAFVIIADFIVDRKRRLLTRHWLLLCMSLTNIAFLGTEIYIREFGHTFQQSERICLILQHTDKTIEFVTVLYLIVVSLHIVGGAIRPHAGCRKKMVLFWIVFILFIMVCANLAIMALFTMKLEHAFPESTQCQLDPTPVLSRSSVHLVSMATFYIPYGIVLILVLSALVCSFVLQKKLARAQIYDNEFTMSRKYATIFLFITTTSGFLLMLPFYMFQTPEIAGVFMSEFQLGFLIVYFVTMVVKLVFYVLFPALCLLLTEVRDIYRKLISS